MKKTMKAVISVSIALLMLFMLFVAVFAEHEHMCGHNDCIQCELLRSVNDLVLLLLVLCTILAIIPIIISLLAFILTKYRGIELSPIKLRDKLSN